MSKVGGFYYCCSFGELCLDCLRTIFLFAGLCVEKLTVVKMLSYELTYNMIVCNRFRFVGCENIHFLNIEVLKVCFVEYQY